MRPDVGTAVACLPRNNLETHTVSGLIELQTLNAAANDAAVISREREVAELGIIRQRQIIAGTLSYFEKWQRIIGPTLVGETVDADGDNSATTSSPLTVRRVVNEHWQRPRQHHMPDHRIKATLHPDTAEQGTSRASGVTYGDYTTAKDTGNLALAGALLARVESSVVDGPQDLTYPELMLRVYRSYGALSAVPSDFVSLTEIKKWQTEETNLLPALIRLGMILAITQHAIKNNFEINPDGYVVTHSYDEYDQAKLMINLLDKLKLEGDDEAELRRQTGDFSAFDKVFEGLCDTYSSGDTLGDRTVNATSGSDFHAFAKDLGSCIGLFRSVPSKLRGEHAKERRKSLQSLLGGIALTDMIARQ